MFSIFAERVVKSNFNLEKDVQDIATMILSASRAHEPARGVVFFVGEMHSSAYDVGRRRKLIERLRGQPNIFLVLEKGFDDEFNFSQLEQQNIFPEETTIVGINPLRDLSVIEGILETGKFLTHVVVFFFGQDHDAKMKLFFRQVGAGGGDFVSMRLQEKYQSASADRYFSWWTCLPIDEALEREDDSQVFQNNTEPCGYISDSDANIKCLLLKKGIVNENFEIEILSKSSALGTIPRANGILAVFFGNKERNRRVRKVVNGEGSYAVTIRRGDACKAVPTDRKTLQ